ncbi:hypothetical protein AXG93_4666s1130 [Marchantia polymorpha subsp. ruderalis]|uniref:F-box domain-containing protein n=1 Tax=Marchantia polymorpha subsp. ruderalis TaxID=1480154 RepID=A0A176W3Q1_MARPO|nr:hypothetical protein AXG93_4666s1130 [Marchantia polymorpha subsp. ruderalis]
MLRRSRGAESGVAAPGEGAGRRRKWGAEACIDVQRGEGGARPGGHVTRHEWSPPPQLLLLLPQPSAEGCACDPGRATIDSAGLDWRLKLGHERQGQRASRSIGAKRKRSSGFGSSGSLVKVDCDEEGGGGEMPSPFPDEVLEHVLVFLQSHKDRNSVSLVCKAWFKAEKWSRHRVFVGNCYAVSPQMVINRFSKLNSLHIKGRPRFADFGLVPHHWGAYISPWVTALAQSCPWFEELRLKRMTVSDDSLLMIAQSFPNFKSLILTSCDGLSTDGLAYITSSCRASSALAPGRASHEISRDFRLLTANWDESEEGPQGPAQASARATWGLQAHNRAHELRSREASFAGETSRASFGGEEEKPLWGCCSGRESRVGHLERLDLEENEIEPRGGEWLSCFPDNHTSLVSLNFATVDSAIDFDALEALVERSKNLRSLKVHREVNLEQLNRLLARAPNLVELGSGSYTQLLKWGQYSELSSALGRCKQLRSLSGFWEVEPVYLPSLFAVCANLTSLNLSYVLLHTTELVKLIPYCQNLERLLVQDYVGDKGLQAVAVSCRNLQELRVYPSTAEGFVTEEGLIAISEGCPNLMKILYFCKSMTNAAVITFANKLPNCTHFRLCILTPGQPDCVTNEPMDKGFGAVVQNCKKLTRLAVSGQLTDRAFEYFGMYGKKLETISIAFAGDSDRGLEYVLKGCPNLRKLEIRDCPFGDDALLSGVHRYEQMKSMWMSACKVSRNGAVWLAKSKPSLNVEIIKENTDDDPANVLNVEKLYLYRTLVGRRSDAPDFVEIAQ